MLQLFVKHTEHIRFRSKTIMTKKVFYLSLILFASIQASADITIVANPGQFESIEKAANAEKQVDFWDADLTDDRACTECFAALELKTFLLKSLCASFFQQRSRLNPIFFIFHFEEPRL